MGLDSKHTEARFSPNATDSLCLLVAQVWSAIVSCVETSMRLYNHEFYPLWRSINKRHISRSRHLSKERHSGQNS